MSLLTLQSRRCSFLPFAPCGGEQLPPQVGAAGRARDFSAFRPRAPSRDGRAETPVPTHAAAPEDLSSPVSMRRGAASQPHSAEEMTNPPATHFPREERNPGDPSGSPEESKDQPREKPSPPPPLFSRGGRGSLAPFHPAFYFPLRGGEDFAMAVLAPSLPVPAPLELRHPPVQPTATASN